MKQKTLFILLMLSLLTACSAGQASTPVVHETDAPLQSGLVSLDQPQGEADSVQQDIPSPTIAPTSTATPKPLLEKDAWMQMPVVPTEISGAMREVYQRGLEMGNDPTTVSAMMAFT